MSVQVDTRLATEGGAFGFRYKAMYDGSLPLAEVLQGIPTRFGLSEDLCEAWHVHGYKKFHKNDTPAATALLQVAGRRRVVIVDMQFTPSLALYIWTSFKDALWQAVQSHKDVEGIWMVAADICCTQGCIAASMADGPLLHGLLAVDPLQALSAAMLLHHSPSTPITGSHMEQLTLCLNPITPESELVLPQVEPLTRTLLLFAQLLAVVAAERNSIFTNTTAPDDSTQKGELLRSAIAGRLQQLTDFSCCTPVLLPDIATQTEAPNQPKPSKHVSMLRSAVLILKLATVTFAVKADVPGSVDLDMPLSQQTLWHITSMLTANISDSITASRSASACSGCLKQACSECVKLEEQTLCVALFDHSIATLRQTLKDPKAGLQKLACLQLLIMLLDAMHPALLRNEVKRLAVLPLMVAFLDQRREEGQAALQILLLLCSSRIDLLKQHADLLVMLQGARRLSNIFCTGQASTKAGSASSHTSAMATAVNQERLLTDVNTACGAVGLVSKLLELHPLSDRPLPKVSGSQPSHDHDQALRDISNGLCCTPADESTHVLDSLKWPTPRPSEWQDIELVALRACNALGWALSPTVMHRVPTDTVNKLVGQLCQLIQRLVSGHLPDLDLDMQKLFETGLQPILTAQLAGYAEITNMAAALYARMVSDSSLAPYWQEHARQMCSVFCNECMEYTGEKYVPVAPSALLSASTKILHLIVAGFEDVGGLDSLFIAAFERAMSVFADSLSHRLMLCVCLGTLSAKADMPNGSKVSKMLMKSVKLKGLHDAIFTTLQQVMQVPTPWDTDCCFATGTMLIKCCCASLLESPPLSLRSKDMQRLLVHLLQQLRDSKITNDQRLLKMLLTGCCTCLQRLCRQSGAVNHSAAILVISDWLVAMEVADPVQQPAETELRPTKKLCFEAVPHHLCCTIMCYLDSQKRWHEFAQCGLRPFLRHICARLQLAAKLPVEQPEDDYAVRMPVQFEARWYFHMLSTATKLQALQPPCLTVNGDDATAATASGSHDPHDPSEDSLLILWRRAACAALVLLSSRCREARQVYTQYKDSRETIRKIRQKRSYVADICVGPRLLEEAVELISRFGKVQEQIVLVQSSFLNIQQEPAWPSIMAGHQPQDWMGSVMAPDRNQDLAYLAHHKFLSSEGAQAIHSFYVYMLGEDSAAATAEELVAEEAREAAKAAAKKAKKQKAKARKQQARSGADSAAESSAGASLQAEQDVEPMATLHQSRPPGSTAVSPDEHTAGLQTQLQHVSVHNSDMHTLPAPALLDEEASISGAADALSAIDTSRGADESFLDQLFCCPITKVVMVDPVIAADGHTYERTAIQHWLQGSSLSPVTRDKLPHTRLVPNVLVKSALAQHAQLS